MLVAIVVITIDSQIGYVADFIPEQLSSNVGVFTFVVIAVIFVITQYLILDYVKKSNKEARKRVRHISKLHTGVTVAQYFLASVVVIVILQILLTQQYNTITLYIVYAISFGLWILILALLTKAFLSWYKLSCKNVMVLIFTLSMIVYVVNAHMEQELQSTVMKIAKKQANVLTEKTGVESSMTESDIKEYMAMVMNEIHKS